MDVAYYVRRLQQAGWPRIPVAVEFLTQFGGLRIEIPHPCAPGHPEPYTFGEGTEGWEPHEIRHYEDLILSPVCPIAQGDAGGIMIVLMAVDGHVYEDADGPITWVGMSGEDAIEALCTRRERPPPVPRAGKDGRFTY